MDGAKVRLCERVNIAPVKNGQIKKRISKWIFVFGVFVCVDLFPVSNLIITVPDTTPVYATNAVDYVRRRRAPKSL
jgi:hypothetical protein